MSLFFAASSKKTKKSKEAVGKTSDNTLRNLHPKPKKLQKRHENSEYHWTLMFDRKLMKNCLLTAISLTLHQWKYEEALACTWLITTLKLWKL